MAPLSFLAIPRMMDACQENIPQNMLAPLGMALPVELRGY